MLRRLVSGWLFAEFFFQLFHYGGVSLLAFFLCLALQLLLQLFALLNVTLAELVSLVFIQLQTRFLIRFIGRRFLFLFSDSFPPAQIFSLIFAESLPAVQILNDILLLIRGELLKHFVESLHPSAFLRIAR